MTVGAAQTGLPERLHTIARSSSGWTQRRVLLLGRAEAGRLCRSPLVAAGLLASVFCVWWNSRQPVPVVWWSADMSVGGALLIAAGTVLIAAHLAAGRASRDGMTQLYASYPAPAAVRTGGLLLGVAGPVALAGAVAGAAVVWLDSQGALGSPRPDVLAGAVLLVALAGTLGVALGGWLPHPMTGILTAIVLGTIELDVVLSADGWVHLNGPGVWLLPWVQSAWELQSMPGGAVPVPSTAHASELAGLTGLAVAAALWPALHRPLRRPLFAAVAAGCLVVTGWSGWIQDRPVPLSQVVYQATHPAQAEQCVTQRAVRYCYYPAFRPLVDQWAVPVTGVLALLPRQPTKVLVVRQVVSDLLLYPPLAPSRSSQAGAYTNFSAALDTDPTLIQGSSVPPVYTGLSWGRGSTLGQAQSELSMSTALWATGLPTTGRQVYVKPSAAGGGTFLVPCVAVGQAREAIAIWLAASATPAALASFSPPSGSPFPVQVGKRWIAGDGPMGAGTELTAQGVELASEMLRLPVRRVEAVLAGRWPGWLSPQATDAQLAVALGVRLPLVTVQRPLASGRIPGTNGYISPQPPSQVCK